MDIAEWKQAWDMALTAFVREPIEAQIAIGLTVALMILMMLEGIRANFFPRRRHTYEEEIATPSPPDAMPVASVTAQHFTPRDTGHIVVHARRKPAQQRPRAQRNLLPKIHRQKIEHQEIPELRDENGEQPLG